MKVFIGCSAQEQIPDNIHNDCRELLEVILKDNDLIFGACDTGIMGDAYRIAKKNNRKVIGMCSKFYEEDFSRLECDKKILTEYFIDSTLKIIQNSDAILILPGGFGTLYELFTTIYSKLCDEHNLKIVLYNSCGHYDELINFIEKMYKNKFAKEEIKKRFFIANTKEEVINYL